MSRPLDTNPEPDTDPDPRPNLRLLGGSPKHFQISPAMPLGLKPNPTLGTERPIPKGLATEPKGLRIPEQDQMAEPATRRETTPFGTLGMIRWRKNCMANTSLRTFRGPLDANRNLTLPLNHAPNTAPHKDGQSMLSQIYQAPRPLP